MRGIVHIFAFIGLVGGSILLANALLTPDRYTGVEMTLVYAEATYYAVVAIGALLFGIFLEVFLLAVASDPKP